MAKKKKKKDKVPKNYLPEAHRTLFELEIDDVKRRIERMKQRCNDLDKSSDELHTEWENIDKDTGKEISYLKRMIMQKMDEVDDLKEQLKELLENGAKAIEDAEKKIVELTHKFKVTVETMISEIKVLNSKLNILEKFRTQRETLMERYEMRQNELSEKEVNFKHILYEVERKFIIDKDKLKKEMGNKILQLSSEYQNVAEKMTPDITKHTIRENIAITNELDIIQDAVKELTEENKRLKVENTHLKDVVDVRKKETEVVISRNCVQTKLMSQVSAEHATMRMFAALMGYSTHRLRELENEARNIMTDTNLLNILRRVFLQKYHGLLYEHHELEMRIEGAEFRRMKYYEVVDTCHTLINTTVREKGNTGAPIDDALDLVDLRQLLEKLLENLDVSYIDTLHVPMESRESLPIFSEAMVGTTPKICTGSCTTSSEASTASSSSSSSDMPGSRLDSCYTVTSHIATPVVRVNEEEEEEEEEGNGNADEEVHEQQENTDD